MLKTFFRRRSDAEKASGASASSAVKPQSQNVNNPGQQGFDIANFQSRSDVDIADSGSRREAASVQTPITLCVNGSTHQVDMEKDTPLLYVLRNDLLLNGPKYGCGLGQCGACAVLIDGVATRSCVVPVGAVVGRTVTSLEGLGSPESLGVVQQAFLEMQAAQCGYCTNGMIVTAHAFLSRNPNVEEEDIKRALQFNLCRCGTHIEIVAAVKLAASRLRGGVK